MSFITVVESDWKTLVAEVEKLLGHANPAVVAAAAPVQVAAEKVAASAVPAPAAAPGVQAS